MANGIGVFLVLLRLSNEEGLDAAGADLIRVQRRVASKDSANSMRVIIMDCKSACLISRWK